ncbi:hypothetical protein KSF_030400 [Reticulibacter mediterranei]|uniref:Uncharacterized protein n=1 Tax=Reticulibacter mediterranei TaxID=2778369 RepID=A0A8J3N0K0_9CHLR|nr:hypothetical protein [Reticulibacter mediterranei]GHO92992.1 hypothetical protein KSF_030400 [Reticulibacter mediterranei]
MNYELLTYTIMAHQRELQQEVEQQRLLARFPGQSNSTVRHAIGQCGVILIRVGMKLKQVEMHGKPQTI